MTKQIITAETIRLAWKAGESVVVYAKGDIVTQQAQDDARYYGITQTTEAPVVPEPAPEPEAPAAPAQETVPEPVSQPVAHQPVPTPALTAEQLAAATRQLQEVLVPLTQALTATVKPAAPEVPPITFTPGVNPMSVEAAPAANAAVTVSAAPAEPRSEDALVAAIRRGVLSALPSGAADEALIDQLIRSVLAETGRAPSETRPGVRRAGGVTHVDSRAQNWGSSRAKGSVSVMDVLSPAKGDNAAVGYLDWENHSFSWTFRRAEVLVVLEGELNLTIEGTTFSAAHGDVFSIPAGTEVLLASSGHVRCTTVAVAA